MNKYRNVRTTRGDIKFDSIFEARVYDVLRGGDYTVATQYPVVLASKNKYFPQTTWKVDFCLFDSSGKIARFIEAKSPATITEAFRVKMRWLAHLDPLIFEKCFFVFPDSDFGGFDKHSPHCIPIYELKDKVNGLPVN